MTAGADQVQVGELLAAWVGIRMEEVGALADETRSRVDAIPDQRTLWLLFGEALGRLRALELEVTDLRKAAGR
jgi:hypothetical protein